MQEEEEVQEVEDQGEAVPEVHLAPLDPVALVFHYLDLVHQDLPLVYVQVHHILLDFQDHQAIDMVLIVDIGMALRLEEQSTGQLIELFMVHHIEIKI